jgi:TonB family protein
MFRKFILTFFFMYCFCVFANAQQGQGSGTGKGSGNGVGNNIENKSKDRKGDNSISIISKPQSRYTEAARQNNVQGTITLSIKFLKNGKIGKVKIVNGLPDGLNENTIEAAKLIKFLPATKNGKPITVTKLIQYSFTLY